MEWQVKALGIAVVGLLVSVIVAAWLYVAVLQEKLGVEKELAYCEAKASQLSIEAESLEKELESCKSSLEEKTVEVETLETKLANATRTAAELEKALREAEAKLSKLRENYTRLSKAYITLLSNYTELRKEYTELEEEHAALTEKYLNLTTLYHELERKYNELVQAYNATVNEYKALRRNYTVLLEERESLAEKYQAVKKQYEELRAEYDALLTQYTTLLQDYQSLRNRYDRLASSVAKAFFWAYWSSQDNLDTLEEVLESAVYEAKKITSLRFDDQLPYRALYVLRTVMLRLSYCHDNYVRTIDPYTADLRTVDNVLMLPNETWANGCGDCDDLALLVYAALEASKRPGEKLFIVEFYSGDIGHAAVIGVRAEGAEKRYYVIDPAGNYLNGISIYLRLDVANRNGERYYVYLNPLDLRGYAKTTVLEDFYTIVYYDQFTGEKSEEPIVYYYKSAFYALQDWIKDYWGLDSVEEIVIYSRSVYKVFHSISEAASWLSKQ